MGDLVTIDEAKGFLRVNSSMIDAHLATLIAGVESWAANYCGTSWTVRNKTDYLDGGNGLLLPSLRPLVAVSEVHDCHDAAAVDTNYYRVANGAVYYLEDGCVVKNWPEGRQRFRLNYTAGYNNGDTIKAEGSVAAPAGLKLAVLAVIDRLYRVRGGNTFQGVQGNVSRWDSLIMGDCGDLLGPFDLRGVAH